MKRQKTVRAELTENDLSFITESMSCNVPCSDDMTSEEQETYFKMIHLQVKLRGKP